MSIKLISEPKVNMNPRIGKKDDIELSRKRSKRERELRKTNQGAEITFGQNGLPVSEGNRAGKKA